MKPFSANPAPVSHARARTAALLNQLAAPGLGSLLCKRWVAGSAQLLLALVGSILILIWFFREMEAYYGMMFSSAAPQPPSIKMPETGGLLLAAAWFWSLITSLSLMREASDKNADAIKNFAQPPPLKMEPSQIPLALYAIPQWTLNGNAISRTFEFKDFSAALKFVNAVADAAEQAWHHPDIDVRWNKVTLSLCTHSAGGLTEKDFAFAKKADALSVH